MRQREAIRGYLFISPWIIGLILFTVGPILASLVLSFTNWDLLGTPEWVGTEQYTRLFTDRLFWQSLKVTGTYALLTVPTGMIFSLLLALLLNQKVRGLSIFRTIYYLPAVVSGVAVSILWGWIFNPSYGILNAFLGTFGVPPQNWLNNSQWVLPSLALMSLWSVGGGMVIYLAGLQNVPKEYYEAASIDGAGSWAKFRKITLPLMTPVLFFDLIVRTIGSFQTFTQAQILTDGGPGSASLFYVLYIYRNGFRYFDMGYASALAWVLFIIVLLLTILQFGLARRWVYYED